MQCEARRKFIKAQKTDLVRATAALVFYRELYAIERAIKEEIAKTAPEGKADESERAAIRLRIRQERAIPVLERFREWLEAEKKDALPKSPLGIAIGYVQNNWEALTRYTSSGYLAIDNNLSEQHMKTVAIGSQELVVHRERERRQDDGGAVQRGVELPASWTRSLRIPARCLGTHTDTAEGASGRASSGPLVAAQGRQCDDRRRTCQPVRANELSRRDPLSPICGPGSRTGECAPRAADISGLSRDPHRWGYLAPLDVSSAALGATRGAVPARGGGVQRTHTICLEGRGGSGA